MAMHNLLTKPLQTAMNRPAAGVTAPGWGQCGANTMHNVDGCSSTALPCPYPAAAASAPAIAGWPVART
jgi:hypothetical protein